jgi:hypothetical protein
MKFIEIAGNLQIGITNEELVLLEKVKGAVTHIFKHQLDEREQEVARRMVHRGILVRSMYEGNICFTYDGLEDFGGYF